MIAESNPALLRTDFGKKIHGLVHEGDPWGAYALWGEHMSRREDPLDDDALTRSVWERITEYAEQYNQPGVFTAFIGFEWTSSPGGNNLHRNVVFRGDKSRADRIIPFSNYDSTDPEDLWAWMAAYEEETGDRLLAIPHNGNLSNGLMFDAVTLTDRTPLDRDYAERRMRWEPIYEVTYEEPVRIITLGAGDNRLLILVLEAGVASVDALSVDGTYRRLGTPDLGIETGWYRRVAISTAPGRWLGAVVDDEVVVIDENFGVRITSILSPAERIAQLS